MDASLGIQFMLCLMLKCLMPVQFITYALNLARGQRPHIIQGVALYKANGGQHDSRIRV